MLVNQTNTARAPKYLTTNETETKTEPAVVSSLHIKLKFHVEQKRCLHRSEYTIITTVTSVLF
jgi:hypothetical protein